MLTSPHHPARLCAVLSLCLVPSLCHLSYAVSKIATPTARDMALLQLGHKQLSVLTASATHSWVVQVGTGKDAGLSRGGIQGGDHALQRLFCPYSDLSACQPNPKHGVVLSADALRPCRSDVVSNPMATVVAGSPLYISWMGNGHVQNGQSDGTCVRLMLTDFAQDPEFGDFTELPGGSCVDYWHLDSSGVAKTDTWINIPSSTMAGRHTLLWYWNFTDFWYSSCADIQVVAPEASPVTTSAPAEITTSEADQPSRPSEEQITAYLRLGCSAGEPGADTFCVSYIGAGSYCKYWLTDECGRSPCHQGGFLLPCGSSSAPTMAPMFSPTPLPSQSPTPAPTPSSSPSSSHVCGHKLCDSIQKGSWCKWNGVCQWSNVPCMCDESTSTDPSMQTTTTTTTASAIETSTSTVSPIPDERKYMEVKKALYVWNVGDLGHHWWDWNPAHVDLLVSVCRVHGFTKVIVFIGSVEWDWQQHFRVNRIPHQDQFVRLFASLKQYGISPSVAFYLNDSPNNMTGWERAADVVSAVDQFNVNYPQSAVVGIDGDQEPTNIGHEYLSMNAAIRARRDALNAELELAASIKPGWLRRMLDGALMVDSAMQSLDTGMMMAYSSTPDISKGFGQKALSAAVARSKKMSVAVETNPRALATDSLWSLASKNPIDFMKLIVDMDTFYRELPANHAYDGMVIHDYEGFFEAMYGVKTTSYTAGLVTDLHHGQQ